MKLKSIQSITPPILFAAYSVLSLYTFNLGEVQFISILRTLLLTLLMGVVLTLFFRCIIKDWSRSGLMATWSLFLFLTYGHFYNLARGWGWAASLARHRMLLPIWALLFLGGFFLLIKWQQEFKKLPQILNIVMSGLVLFSLLTLGRHTLAQHLAKRSYPESEAPTRPGFSLPQNPPDVYYILLDGYTRADVLLTQFSFDNSEFIKSLEAFGFYIADCSRSNYEHTHLTLPSLMNMAYIDQLVGEIPPGATVESLRFDDLTKNNQVMEIFKSMGYETVAFENSYYWAQLSKADVFYEPSKTRFFSPTVTEFEMFYFDTTLIAALRDWAVKREIDIFKGAEHPNETHAMRVKFTLDKLKELPEMAGPQFVMAHLVVPHPPYIFNQDGVIPNLKQYDENWEVGELGQAGYLNNIRFINQEILQVIDEILEKSATPPIIILQADHGSEFYDRTMILSAFYLPGSASQAFYPHITPVNTFRLVFKQAFDAPYDLLPDQTFSGKYPPFDFQPIEESYPACQLD